MDKDRLIVTATALPGVLGLGITLLLTHNWILAGSVAVVLSLIAVAISLSPPVKAARLRILKRKYPPDD